MKKLLFATIVTLGTFSFGQTNDFEYEDGRNAHMVPTKEQKDLLQCSNAALFREVTQIGHNRYEVKCSDYEFTYTYIKDYGSPSGGGDFIPKVDFEDPDKP